jgi:NAD(P)H dehydrogenase (quinone)
LKTLVVHCHPDPASFNAALYRTACEALQAAGHELRCIDLYA